MSSCSYPIAFIETFVRVHISIHKWQLYYKLIFIFEIAKALRLIERQLISGLIIICSANGIITSPRGVIAKTAVYNALIELRMWKIIMLLFFIIHPLDSYKFLIDWF